MKKLIYLIAVLIGLSILFLIVSPKKSAAPTNESLSQNQTKVFTLVVKNNKLVSGPSVLKVNQGDKVTIRITADVDGELHLHGYDKHVDFMKDKIGEISLISNLSGRFPYELEDTKTEIGALEVQPN